MIALLLACGELPAEGLPAPGDDIAPPHDDDGDKNVVLDDCTPDGDPSISFAELPFTVGAQARYLHASEAVQPAWNLSGIGHEPTVLGVEDVDVFWFADDYPSATHVSALDSARTTFGVYRADASGVYLLGMASGAPGDTALVYTPAVPLWSWPLDAGSTVDSTVVATGLFEGEAYPKTVGWSEIGLEHSWAVTADARDDLVVDAGVYEAVRVRLDLRADAIDQFDVDYGSVQTSTTLYLSACAGMVARISGDDFVALGLPE